MAQRCPDFASRQLYREALTTASTNQRADIVENLLESNLEFDFGELTDTLNSICAWGSKRILQTFLQHDTKKVLGIEQYSSGLDQAAQNDNCQVVMYWLEEHPEHQNLVVDPATVIHVSGNGFMDILPPFIERIMPMDSFEKTLSQCLQVASNYGHEKVVEYLIGEGANVNAVVEEAHTLIGLYNFHFDPYNHFGGSQRKLSALQAALSGCELLRNTHSSWRRADAPSQQRVVELLLRKGADPNRAEGYRRYPLNIAAKNCTVQVVQALISSGANTETATEEYETALQTAARREVGPLPIIKTLIEASGSTSSFRLGKAAALSEALSFFGTPGCSREGNYGHFLKSISVVDVLSAGPGAVVKILLANLPEERADDTRYGLLAQMACIAGDQECIELLIKRGMDVNVPGSYYGTVLQAASRVGNIQIVERLLNSGANVNILSGVHGTALLAAVIRGHEDLVRMLIARGADVNLRHKDKGQSVLHLALESRNQAIFEILLNAGADVNPDIKNQTHIFIEACKHGDTALVELLLARGVDISVSGRKSGLDIMQWDEATPLHAACANGQLSLVQLLLDHGADVKNANESSATPLIAAIRGKLLPARIALLKTGWFWGESWRLETVEELLRARATISGLSTKENALARAYNNRHYMVAELLLANLSGNEYEAEICDEALSAAINCGDDEMVLLLLEHGVSPSFEMLRQACVAGVLQVVRMLVDTGIDVNRVDGDDAPLLHVAASHLRSDIVQFLINRGTNVMHRSTRYGSPLIAALEGSMAPLEPKSCGSLAGQPFFRKDRRQKKLRYKKLLQCERIVGSLFNAGAKVDTIIGEFGNALHLASYMGSDVIVRQLLERMEDVNIFGGYFETALIAGLKGDHPIIVDLLLDRGIDVNHYSPEHGFSLHCACRHGSKSLVQKLLDHGADINAFNEKHGSALAVAVSRDAYLGFRGDPYGEARAIIDLLLHHEPKVRIRECDLLAAASRGSPDLMSLFLRRDPSAVATEAVIVEAIENYRDEILPLLLERDDGLGPTPDMLIKAAAKGSKMTKILLEHKPSSQAAADIVESMKKRVAPKKTLGSRYAGPDDADSS